MIRITVFFIGGIVLAIYQPGIFSGKAIFLSATILAFLFFVITGRKSELFSFWAGIIGLATIFFLGYARLQGQMVTRHADHLSKVTGHVGFFEAVVRSMPQEKAKSWKIEVELIRVKTTDDSITNSHWHPATGKMLLYIAKNNVPEINLRYGDRIILNGSPQPINPPANPGEFDFKRFLSFKNITHQLFIKPTDYVRLPAREPKGMIYYANEARKWSLQKLAEFIPGKNEQAVASALVLGVTDAIDDDTISAYAASGALHVLAVSGMHVGIIYAIILFLFKPAEKFRGSKWVVALVSLVLLWSFAFITGLSPSVLRAVAMFSFVALARPFGIRTNIYNTLATSAFVLLLYNPYLIMSVGFQLSYLAVFGIVYLQQPIYHLWEIKNRIGDWIWQMTCISIAAQLATFVLSLLYFHQFPTYFLVSNLFVIPLSTLVLLAGMAMLAISFITPVAIVMGWAVGWLVRILNGIVFATESLPFSLINNIHISIFQCWLLFVILIALILLVQFRKIQWLYLSFLVSVVFLITTWFHFSQEVNQKQWISYAIKGHQAMEFIDRGHSYFIADSSLVADHDQIRFHIQPNRLIHGIASVHTDIPFQKMVKGVYYLRWDNRWQARIISRDHLLPTNINMEMLIVGHQALSKKELNGLLIKQIFFDGSNSDFYVQSMSSQITSQSKIFTSGNKNAFIQ